MPEPDPAPIETPPPPRPGPLGGVAIRGAAGTMGFALAQKAVTVAGQFALAALLVPAELGLASLALAVSSLAPMLGQGQRDLLIQRPGRFAQDASQVCWMTLSLCILGAVATLAALPLIMRLYPRQDLQGLPFLIVLAVGWTPLLACNTVTHAALSLDLRFGALARINAASGILYTAGCVVLAAAGFGAASLIFPLWLSILFSVLVSSRASRPIRLDRPRPALWGGLFRPASWLILQAFLVTFLNYGPSLVAGLRVGPVDLGLFTWGLAIASQMSFLLALNLRQVLFPVLARISDEPERQAAGLRTAARVMTAGVAPLAILQMLVAGPFLHVFFPARWHGAAPVVAWLSLGLLTQPLQILAHAALMARGRFRTLAALTGLQGAALLAALALASGGVVGMASTAGIVTCLANAVLALAAVRTLGHSPAAFALSSLRPFGAAVLAGVGVLAVEAVRPPTGPAWTLIIRAGMYALLAAGLLRLLAPDILRELLKRGSAAAQVGTAAAGVEGTGSGPAERDARTSDPEPPSRNANSA